MPAGRARRGQGVPALARRRPFHVPRAIAATTSSRSTARTRCRIVPGSSLGILREDRRKDVATSFAALPPEVRAYARVPDLLIVTKANARSTVHRPGLSRLRRHQALRCRRATCAASIASSASTRRPRTAPIRRTFRCCAARPRTSSRGRGVAAGSHAGKALLNILATYPRDELFQIARGRPAAARRWASCIWASGSASGCSCGAIRSSAFVVCLIYAPRENYTTELREKWQAILLEAFNGDELGIQRAPVGVGAGAHHDHGAHDAGRDPGVRRARARGPARGGRATLGRRSPGRADRGAGRGAGQRAVPPFRRRVARRLSRRVRCARGGAGHRDDGDA